MRKRRGLIMIRKTIIVGLTFLAMASAIAWPLSDADWPERFFWESVNQRFYVAHYPYMMKNVRVIKDSRWYFAHDRLDPARHQSITLQHGRLVLRAVTPNQNQVFVATLGLYVPIALFAAYPLFALIRGPWRRWRRPREGYCTHCGYNLTGNVSGTCPECGTSTSTQHPRRIS